MVDNPIIEGRAVVERLTEIVARHLASTCKALNLLRGENPPCKPDELEDILKCGEYKRTILIDFILGTLPQAAAVYNPNAGYDDLPSEIAIGFTLFDDDAKEVSDLCSVISRDAQERLRPYWPAVVKEFNERLKELIAPYLKKKDYGNLCGSGGNTADDISSFFDKKEARWIFVYELGFGSSSSGIFIKYNVASNKWTVDHGAEIEDLKIVLDCVAESISRITERRVEHMRMIAQKQKEGDIPLSQALLAINAFDVNPNGPTAREKLQYHQICKELYAQ